MEKNTRESLETVIYNLEEKYKNQIFPSSNIMYILSIENKSEILPTLISPKTNKYRKTIGIPIKDMSSYDTTEIKGNIFENYVQLKSGLIVPEEFALEIKRLYEKYSPQRKIIMCQNYNI